MVTGGRIWILPVLATAVGRIPVKSIPGGISSSVLSVFFTDKFALSQSDARISVAYNSCQ